MQEPQTLKTGHHPEQKQEGNHEKLASTKTKNIHKPTPRVTHPICASTLAKVRLIYTNLTLRKALPLPCFFFLNRFEPRMVLIIGPSSRWWRKWWRTGSCRHNYKQKAVTPCKSEWSQVSSRNKDLKLCLKLAAQQCETKHIQTAIAKGQT